MQGVILLQGKRQNTRTEALVLVFALVLVSILCSLIYLALKYPYHSYRCNVVLAPVLVFILAHIQYIALKLCYIISSNVMLFLF